MTLTGQIAKNTSIQIAGKAVSVLLGLAAVAIMARSLGAEKFGWYVTAVGFLQFIGIFCDFGFIVTTANMLSEPRFDKSKLLNTLFSWRFLTAVVLQGASPFLILFFPYSWEIKLAVFVTALSFICVSINNVFIGWCQSQLKIKIQVIGELAGRVALVGGLALLAYIGAGFLPMMGAVTGAAVIYTGYLWLNSPRVKLEFDKEISRALFKKIWPLAIAIIFNTVYLQGDRLILPLYVSQVEVGFYGAAYRVLDIAAQAAFLVMGIMLPVVSFAWSRGLAEEFKKRFQMSFDLALLAIAPMIAGIMALSGPLMRLIAGSEFAGADAILRVLAIAIFGICFGTVFGNIALAMGRQRQAMWVAITDAVLSLVGYLIFIPRFGVWGAAGVTIFSEFYAGLGYLIVSSRQNFWPRFKNPLKIMLASATMGLFVFYIQPMNLFLSIGAGILTYTTLIFALRVISKQTLKETLLRE